MNKKALFRKLGKCIWELDRLHVFWGEEGLDHKAATLLVDGLRIILFASLFDFLLTDGLMYNA